MDVSSLPRGCSVVVHGLSRGCFVVIPCLSHGCPADKSAGLIKSVNLVKSVILNKAYPIRSVQQLQLSLLV